jgi:ornithine carbamoyltransferase
MSSSLRARDITVSPDAVVVRCLPAHRGEAITFGVMGGSRSIILEQSGHRLRAHKALLVEVSGG